MLNKLLKYDLKYMIRNMCIFYILAIFFAILTRILSSIDQSIIINIIGKITMGCMFSMVASILMNTMLRSWIRFNDSLYKDESYLTHTLPVTKSQLYNSKFLQTLIFYIFGFIIIVLSLFIAFYSKENWTNITNFIKTITTGFNMSTAFFIIMFLLIIFLEVFNAIQCGFLGIILGHKKNNAKVGFSILFGFITYLISQSIVLLLVYVYGFFDSTVMELFKTYTINIDVTAFKTLAIISSVLYIIIILLMKFICIKELKKGVNVE